jgi:Bcr/CflA subfamily drug resistance transporter
MNTQRIVFINIMLIAFLGGLATDIYAPSLAAIAQLMHVPIEKAQFSLTIFMVGMAASQLLYGPLSEGLGRRLPLIAGLFIFIVGSCCCFFATEIKWLILGRIIQGLGAGSCSSLWRSIFRDVFHGDDLAKYSSWMAILITFIVPAVPVLGGFLQHYIGWRANFGFLLVYSISTLFSILFIFQETSAHHHPQRLKTSFIAQTFKTLLFSRIFMGYTLMVFFCYGAFFSWIAIAPALLIKQIGLSPVQFGWCLFILSLSAMGLAGMINGKILKRMGARRMIYLGFILMFLAGCLMFIGQLMIGVNFYAIVLPVFLFNFGVSFIWPNAFAGAFTPFGTIAGYVGSLYSFFQLGGGAIIGSITAHLPAHSQFPLSIIFTATPIISWTLYRSLITKE